MSETPNAPNALGAFLQARRNLVTPQQVGIPGGQSRRVPGLRREEVAVLAGISPDYYLRLERGRDRNPSVKVLESIARVLQLDDAHTAHLFKLASDTPHGSRYPRHEVVPPSALMLMNSLAVPAFIEGRYFDILASNRLAQALTPALVPGVNQLEAFFLDQAVQSFYPDWDGATECFVASLRMAVGKNIDDPRYVELTDEILPASARFRQLWARHEVRGQHGTVMRINHPELGLLLLNRELLRIEGADGLMLIVYHPDPGSDSAEKLAHLFSVVPSVSASGVTAA